MNVSIRHMFTTVCFVLLISLFAGDNVLAFDLQAEINQAQEGDVLVIPPGEYEGPFTINKSLILQGEHEVTLYNRSGKHVLCLNTHHVQLMGLTLLQENKELDVPALLVKGDNHLITDISIQTNGMGIVLEKADQNILRNITIKGTFQHSHFTGSMLTREGNGIDLFRSDGNLIEGMRIEYVQDGIYLEQSDNNTIRDNYVADSRYGLHLMFTKQTNLMNNVAEGNITGAMIMGTVGTNVKHNHFRLQNNHVHAQGIMLYDVQEAIIANNLLEDNLYGLYIDSAENNRLEGNQVYNNYIGLDVRRSEGNELIGNDFFNNIIPARAKDSDTNLVKHNFWDAHFGLDISGDKLSALPYHADIIFPAIIASKPAFQIFADAPGLLFLQMVLETDREKTLTDVAPRMEKNKRSTTENVEKNYVDSIVYCLALFFSLVIIYTGGRKR